jgi:hypothetical protein
MSISRHTFCILLVLACGCLGDTARADNESKIKVVTDWREDEQPIRVDCHNLGMHGDGICGQYLSCSDRLSLYATFSCFPMKKEVVETTCPEWEGLQADIDWARVAELVDAQAANRAAEREKKKREFDQAIKTNKKQLESDR